MLIGLDNTKLKQTFSGKYSKGEKNPNELKFCHNQSETPSIAGYF